jgi:hypothetical protein
MKKSRMRWAGDVARVNEIRNAHSIFVEKPDGKRPLGKPSRKLKDNIKISLT